jgi:hypothetical protein
MIFLLMAICSVLFLSGEGLAQSKELTLDSADGLILHKVSAEPVTYKGRKAIKVLAPSEARPQQARVGSRDVAGGRGGAGPAEENFVFIEGVDFHNGVIEVDVAGLPRSDAGAGSRGFIGLIFRMAPENATHERFYLRPTNGRADDQERRNHASQYVSFPDFGWNKLRTETPSKYEAYVDLVPGEWTKVKVEVEGEKARLYVHGNEQPTLIVNDLKLGADAHGAVALWINASTEGYFSNLRISAE